MKAPLAPKLFATLMILAAALAAVALFIECPGCGRETSEFASSLASLLGTMAGWAVGASGVLLLGQLLWDIWK